MQHQWKRFWILLTRDSLIIVGSLLCWLVTADSEAGLAETGLIWSIVLAVLTVLSGFLVHEWGHLIGAMLARAAVRLPNSPVESPFLFRFDALSNTREQFAMMSVGGFVVSAVLVVLLVWFLPLESLAGQLALGLTSLGVLATIVLELPEFLRVWRGQAIPQSAAYFTPDEN